MAKNTKESETYRCNGVWGMTLVKADELRDPLLKLGLEEGEPLGFD